MALNTRLLLDIAAEQTSPLDLGTASFPVRLVRQFLLADGNGANQANKLWTDTRTTSGTDALDLAGALTDAFGATVQFAKLRALLVAASPANAANVNVVSDATSGIAVMLAKGDGIVLRPGGLFLWVATDATGIAVTGGSTDVLNVVSASGSVTYDIAVIGTN